MCDNSDNRLGNILIMIECFRNVWLYEIRDEYDMWLI
jgi:hypothetical protein